MHLISDQIQPRFTILITETKNVVANHKLSIDQLISNTLFEVVLKSTLSEGRPLAQQDPFLIQQIYLRKIVGYRVGSAMQYM